MRKRSEVLLLALGIAGCSGAPSHVPPMWQLPGAAVSSAFENATYDARRREVKRLIASNGQRMRLEIDRGGGPGIDAAMDAARIPADTRSKALDEMRSHPDIYYRGDGLDIEAVTVALMVYGR